MDNTTFGNNVPTLPQWTGPPRTMVHVQAILFASLATSLFSAFLAMLGKQWLNRYESADMRGSAIERSQNRQRKLDGIDAWYFNSVMESLPLMLQVALLLLGCALSRYLWNIDTTIALVVLGITSVGVVFYLFVIIAGVATGSCPYQTPASLFLRYIGPKFWKLLYSASTVLISALGNPFRETTRTIQLNARYYRPWRSWSNTTHFLSDLVSELPPAFAADAHRLWRAAIQALAVHPTRVRHLFRRVHNRSRGTSPTPEQRLTRQTAVLGLRCISWALQTSLDKAVHRSAMVHLLSVLELAEFGPTLIVDCFNVFLGSISVSNQRVVITQGLEQLARLSAQCFCRTFYRLTVMDPASRDLEDIRRRYCKVFPREIDFSGHPSHHAMTTIHSSITRYWNPDHTWCDDDRLSNREHIPLARDIAKVAQAEYQREQAVPPWILRFALNSLSLDPLPPASVVADCLTVVAIDLGCNVSDVATLDKRCLYLSFLGIYFLTKN